MNQYQQDHGNAPEQVKGRFLVFVIILILMFAYLFAGLVNLQLKSSEGYSTKTESTRLKTIPLTGKRGNITDANSVILATDEMVYNVTFYKDASESSSSVYKTYTQSIIDTLKLSNATAASWHSAMSFSAAKRRANGSSISVRACPMRRCRHAKANGAPTTM